jgi:hypothetical protein
MGALKGGSATHVLLAGEKRWQTVSKPQQALPQMPS